MKFIHISDLHLGKSFSAAQYGTEFAKQRKLELMKTFARIVDFANQNKVDFILCAGDFLNSEDLRMEDLRNINSILNRLQKTAFIAIAGNHDPLGEKSAYRKITWSDSLYLAPAGFGKVALSRFNTVIHYYSWDTKEISKPILEQTEFTKNGQYNILLLHGDSHTKSDYLPFDPQKLEKQGFDYVALGHIHKPCCVGKNMFYAGSPEPLDFGETGQHGFMLCDILGQWTHYHFVPFSQREYVSVKLEAKAEDSEISLTDSIAKIILTENPQNIYTIELTGHHPAGASFDSASIESELRSKEIYCTIQDKTIPDYDIKQIYKENRGNLIGDYISSFDIPDKLTEIEEKALEYGVQALIAKR